jgi:mitochondrial import receptor subunit TOM40
LSATYWRRIAENVQAGADLTLAMVPPSMVGPGGPTKEGRTTVGVKYDFKASSLRTQIDSKGKISLLVEKRVGQVMMMTFATEVDHFSVSLSLAIVGGAMLTCE